MSASSPDSKQHTHVQKTKPASAGMPSDGAKSALGAESSTKKIGPKKRGRRGGKNRQSKIGKHVQQTQDSAGEGEQINDALAVKDSSLDDARPAVMKSRPGKAPLDEAVLIEKPAVVGVNNKKKKKQLLPKKQGTGAIAENRLVNDVSPNVADSGSEQVVTDNRRTHQLSPAKNITANHERIQSPGEREHFPVSGKDETAEDVDDSSR